MEKAIVLTIFSLLFVASCRTGTKVEPVNPEPLRETGCSTYYGAQWQECIKRMFKLWEDRENAPVKIRILDKSRESMFSQTVVYKIEACSADFCKQWIEKREEPAWYHEAAKAIGYLGAGALISKIAAASILL